jgi:hypothetical protein
LEGLTINIPPLVTHNPLLVGSPAATPEHETSIYAHRAINRRAFLAAAAGAVAMLNPLPAMSANDGAKRAPIIDTHVHVWSGDQERFPFAHPYDPNFKGPPIAATVELLLKEMDEFGISHCVLVQMINHGWDNRYLVQRLKEHPKRFRGQGLIDPTDPKVAEKLDYWFERRSHSSRQRIARKSSDETQRSCRAVYIPPY